MFLEDSTFEIMELENDILYESIHLSFFDKVKKFIRDIIEKMS